MGNDHESIDKASIRERVWDDLEDSGVARFPFPPHGRIPNFEHARQASDRLADQPEWNAAATIKTNPDAPQLPVRRRALRDGKTVYVAVPRLADEQCFLELDPESIPPEEYDDATTVAGISTYGDPVGPEAVAPIDLVISGSVAVTPDGGRIGKGEGYSDLEFALLREFGRVDDETPVATTVHERQVIDDPVAIADHDVAMTLIVTPDRVRRPSNGSQPTGIDWSLLDDDRRAEIPVLERLAD